MWSPFDPQASGLSLHVVNSQPLIDHWLVLIYVNTPKSTVLESPDASGVSLILLWRQKEAVQWLKFDELNRGSRSV